jgi:hypothetical protein
MTQLSKRMKVEDEGASSSIVYTAPDTSTSKITFDPSGIHINGVDMQDAMLGTDPTAVSRTNNPIDGTGYVNANIDAVDAAIGADNTAVARTNNPTVVNTTLNAKVQALDNAIGADGNLTVVTRAMGQVTVNSTLMTKVDLLDAAIGADADLTVATRTNGLTAGTTVYAMLDALDAGIGTDSQLPDSTVDADHDLSIYQNLRSLDVNKTVRTVKYTIGAVGSASTLHFHTEDGTTEQCIDLGAIVPALARIVDVFVHTSVGFDGVTSLTVDVGPTTGTNTYIASADIVTHDAILSMAHATGHLAAPNATTATNVWVNATPGAHWDLNTVGQLDVYVTYIDVARLIAS